MSESGSSGLGLFQLSCALVHVLRTCNAGRAGAHPYRATRVANRVLFVQRRRRAHPYRATRVANRVL